MSGSAESLAPINEAWRVLGDPASRRAYDRSLDRSHTRPAPAADGVPPPMPVAVPPSSFPWRFLTGLAVVGIAIALLGVFTYKEPKPAPTDNVLEPGSCVVIEDNGDASEVRCEDRHDGVVESLVRTDELCVAPLEPHRDRQGLGAVCIRFEV